MEATAMQITRKTTKTTKTKVRTYRDLGTWKAAHELATAVCRQAELFPLEGQVYLSVPIAETSVAICTSIAQGFNSWQALERDCHYEAAQAALVRLENHLAVAHGLGYLDQAQHDDLLRRCDNVRWILGKLQRISREWSAKASKTA